VPPTATDGVAWSVGLSLSVGHVREFSKTAKLIEMPIIGLLSFN